MADHTAVREELVKLTEGLLLGPLAADEILSSPPADTYLTGILWPEGTMLGEAEDDNADGAPSSDDGEMDAGVPGYRAVRPCSVGVTVTAEKSATLTISLANTARYELLQESDAAGGRASRRWRRIPLLYRYDIPRSAAGTWRTNEFIGPNGEPVQDTNVQVHIRHRIIGDSQVVTATLINKAAESDERHHSEQCLYQAGLEVRAVDALGAPGIRPRPAVSTAGNDEDTQSAALLYRDVVEYAVGHGVSAMWGAPADGRVESVRTAWMPRAHVKGMSAGGHESLRIFQKRYPDAFRASWLARSDARADVTTALGAFVATYETWIEETLEKRKNKFEGELAFAAERNLLRCQTAARRMSAGITTLKENEFAWRAFALANSAMDRQSRYDAKGEKKGPLVWRPFQLAYFLLVLSGLVDPTDTDRECVDLLWFPTGGGKTEAYLALTAFQIFLRRLTDGGRRTGGGVDVLMRYTLRLLTVQQFQRAASLICACEAMRRAMPELGAASISLGLYVGGDATPNRRADALEALQQEHEGQEPRSTPRQLLKCPVCGQDLPPSCYSATEGAVSIEIRCANSRCETEGHPLPVLTVDDDIYARPASLVIGTIDKFAQLPRRSDLRALFGLDGGLRPGLIIQDELHLISGPLGSMAGLYETVIDLLCTHNEVRPKVIGSTATIGQAARQVRALFDRPVLQFPPSGFEASDSFFAVRDDDGADRLYLGISSAGRSPKFALQATAAALLQAAAVRRQGDLSARLLDPFWTCVLYFNSLRELGGAHVLLQDDIPRQMTFLAGRLESDQRVLEATAVELSSRVPSRELPEYLAQLNVGLSEDDEDPFSAQPRDAVLASNMISVGVDVPRLGLMIVNGQPKSTAEYIQASSRVGRGLDGLIVTHYNFGRPRDVSHFEHFLAYHGALYRSVEATSVTPWAPRARDKALHAVLAAAVRHLAVGMESDSAAVQFNAADPEVRRIVAAICERANEASEGIEGQETSEDVAGIIREWELRCLNARGSGSDLLYWEKKAPFGKTRPYLMTSAEEGNRPGKTGWPTPNSMREVEPSTAFALKVIGKK
ncbi:MAG: helicase [Proteobacteria bacterium]|nr:helicase [Pseudomonadota bacterium]